MRLAALALVLSALPAFAQPQALPEDKLKEIKAAVVYIKVTGEGFSATGSGFVVRTEKDAAWIVTNHHVISVPDDESLFTESTTKIEIIFHSGTSDEFSAKATLVVDDKVNDLALLKITTTKTLPKPLGLTGADKLQETMPVYVCGFPFGANLARGAKNPEISIGPASISSLRKNAKGVLVSVQLNGALNPGNSGGPVVTTDGRIVGVAVTTVRGAGLGNAVPQSFVADLMTSRVHLDRPEYLDAKAEGQRVIRFRVTDPFTDMKEMKLRLVPTSGEGASTPPENLTGMPGYAVYPLTAVAKENGFYEATFALPKTLEYLWLQAEWMDSSKTLKTSAIQRVRIGDPNTIGDGTKKPKVKAAPKAATDLVKDLKDAAGKALPPVSAKPITPKKTPEHWIVLADLNDDATNAVGKKVCVHALTSGVTLGTGDGHALACFFDDDNIAPSNLDFCIDVGMHEAIGKFRTSNGLFPGQKLAVRLTGKVVDSHTDKWKVLATDRVDFLTPEGEISWTVERKTPHKGPAGAKRTTPEKPGTEPTEPAPKAPTVREASIATANDVHLATLANNTLAARGVMTLVVKLEDVERVPLSAREPQRFVHRLIVRHDYRGNAVRNLSIFADDKLAKELIAKMKRDIDLLDDVELTFDCRRYDDDIQRVLATLSKVVVLNKDDARTAKLELKAESDADFLKPTEPAPIASTPTPTSEPSPAPIAKSVESTEAPAKAAKPAEKTEKEGGNMLVIIIASVLGTLGIAGVVFALVAAAKRKGRDADDDEDEEEEERPRKRRR